MATNKANSGGSGALPDKAENENESKAENENESEEPFAKHISHAVV
jgi:hypothetical protein